MICDPWQVELGHRMGSSGRNAPFQTNIDCTAFAVTESAFPLTTLQIGHDLVVFLSKDF